MAQWHEHSAWSSLPVLGWFGMTVKEAASTVSVSLATVKEIVGLLGSMAAICIFVSGIAVWMTGGFRPQSLIVADELTTKVTNLQNDVTAIKATINAGPRPSDYNSQSTKLGELERDVRSQGDRLGDRIAKDEGAQAALTARVDGIEGRLGRLEYPTQAPIRQPR